ncbi:MAG: gliding motility-associated C-terminal domain-containing protein [Saprospiraceae bacterium]|nr:gliding motility-associated C-terminal domain-containing protein [Saprospiraceae bacterium]
MNRYLERIYINMQELICRAGILILAISMSLTLNATHNRAGEITYEQIGELSIRVTITTYTKTSSFQADRDTLELHWGDGTSTKIGRVNGSGDVLPNDIKRNFYVGEHTYPGRATYHMYFTDPNRIANILNVNHPNSIKIEFHLQTSFTFLNSQFQGSNSSAILLQPPIDFACVGQRFIHNANAFDPDGDSLAYELIVPLQDVNSVVPNYQFPDQISPGANNRLTLNPVTGDLIWDAPQRTGEYNVAFKILEYRQGVLINSIIRDMQILVENCENQPPEIEVIEEICVIAGDLVMFDVRATDPDMPAQQLSLTALGGPMNVNVSPAIFSIDGSYRSQPVVGTFSWQTQCEHIAEHPYNMVFKAVDDTRDTTGLATLKHVRIKVIGPPPENVTAISINGAHRISWDRPYACEVTEEDYFLGFTVWRRPNSNPFQPDTCTPGLEGRGYTAIAYDVKEFSDGRYFFLDTDIDAGQTYCYRVTAAFAFLSIAGYRYNHVQSLPSNEDCAGLKLDKPFMTKVSIDETDVSNGVIATEWTRPSPLEIDTLVFTGPYRFALMRGDGFDPAVFVPVAGADFTSETFAGLTDTSFIDMTGLNTQDQVYSYQVAFYVNGQQLFSTSDKASTVRLSSQGSDNEILLSWEADVPWQNYLFHIYRKDNSQSDFTLLGTSNVNSYRDMGLVNGEEYCYYIQTTGTYGFSKLPEPLINLSQVSCTEPEDAVPPCIPILSVQNSCDNEDLTVGGLFINQLSWKTQTPSCDSPDDVAGFRIFYKPRLDSAFTFLAEVDAATTIFDHGSEFGISGCYAVTSLDSLGNESDTSNIVCVENCPFYQLPNVFTPNGDQANDIFRPFPYKFIDHIDLKIFNRWGQLVFETMNPDIEWTGVNSAGKDLSQGVYQYVCVVYEASVDGQGESTNVLKGYIELIR